MSGSSSMNMLARAKYLPSFGFSSFEYGFSESGVIISVGGDAAEQLNCSTLNNASNVTSLMYHMCEHIMLIIWRGFNGTNSNGWRWSCGNIYIRKFQLEERDTHFQLINYFIIYK